MKWLCKLYSELVNDMKLKLTFSDSFHNSCASHLLVPCFTTGSLEQEDKTSICRSCQFLGSKDFHHGWRQAPCLKLLNMKSWFRVPAFCFFLQVCNTGGPGPSESSCCQNVLNSGSEIMHKAIDKNPKGRSAENRTRWKTCVKREGCSLSCVGTQRQWQPPQRGVNEPEIQVPGSSAL